MSITMRVCHIWHNFFPIEFGGVERYILSLSNFLSQENGNVHFVLLTDKSSVSFLRAPSIRDSERIGSLEVHRLKAPFPSLLSKASYKLFHRKLKSFDDLLTVNLYRAAKNIKGIDEVDLFHVHGFWLPQYPTIGLLLSQHFHRPFMITLHGDSVNINDPYAMPIRAPTTLDVLRQAEVVTTFSMETLSVLQKMGLGKNSRLIPNFVDTRLFKRPISRRNGVGTKILMVSRLSKPKDPITPILAFAQVRKQVPEATFEIVGYGPLYEDAKRLVGDLNIEEAVTFHGAKSDVRPFLWDNDIFIGTRGSYITTLEAWAAGLAVTAPEFGIMKELVSNGKNGLLAPPGNIDQLASELLNLIRNKNLRNMIAENGILTSEKYDIRNVAPTIANIYKSLV
jgi:glycosyltransferase involved in cell wall biosynthesis